MAQLGAFPVVWITLKDVIQYSFKDAIGALADKVSLMAQQCSWVLEQNKVRSNDFDPLTMSDAFWQGDITTAKAQITIAL